MKSEFPTTAEEAFQTKSGKYFSDEMITKLRSSCRPPVFVGQIRADSLKGLGACENIELVENSGLMSEVLKIWTMPNDGIDTAIERVSNRFVVSVDVGGRSYRSDNSVISVFDRFGMLLPGGPIERAAIWYGHLDPDILAWLAVRIAVFYNNALLVIENNTIDIEECGYSRLRIYINDEMADLDQKVTVRYKGEEIFSGKVQRTISNLYSSLNARNDIRYSFPCIIEVEMEQ